MRTISGYRFEDPDLYRSIANWYTHRYAMAGTPPPWLPRPKEQIDNTPDTP